MLRPTVIYMHTIIPMGVSETPSKGKRQSELTEAVSISATLGGLPRGPFLEMYDSRRRQYFAMMSTRPSCWDVACCINARKDVSKFFDGGKVTSKTHISCQPLNVLSLLHPHYTHTHIQKNELISLDNQDRIWKAKRNTHGLGFLLTCFMIWQ